MALELPFEPDRGFDRLYGLEIGEISDGLVRGRVPVRDDLRQPAGLLHGGVYAAIAESLATNGTAAMVFQDGNAAMGLVQPDQFSAPGDPRRGQRRGACPSPRADHVGVGGGAHRRRRAAVRTDAGHRGGPPALAAGKRPGAARRAASQPVLGE